MELYSDCMLLKRSLEERRKLKMAANESSKNRNKVVKHSHFIGKYVVLMIL